MLGHARRVLRQVLEAVVLLLLGALALLVVVGVAFRKGGAALVWYDEVASILLAWLTYYGAALAAITRSHIGLPNLVQRFGPRARMAALVFREVVVVGFFVVTAWSGWLVLAVLGDDVLVSLPWVPVSVAQSVIPIGAVLFIVAELLSLTRGEASNT